MTRIESTSSPRSQTARTKRSTSTAVLPVPAPAETKTSPVASTAARCCSFTLAPWHPADGPEVAPGGAVVPLRVVAHVAAADALRERARRLARAVDGAPERLLVE